MQLYRMKLSSHICQRCLLPSTHLEINQDFGPKLCALPIVRRNAVVVAPAYIRVTLGKSVQKLTFASYRVCWVF